MLSYISRSRPSIIERIAAAALLTSLLSSSLVFGGLAVAQSAAETPKFPFVAVINLQSAELMSGGGKNYARVAKADKGDLVIVRGAGGAKHEWYRIVSPKPFLAYITTRLVKKIDETTGQVAAQRVSLRPRASLQRFPIAQVRIGTKLSITGEKNGFYEVIAPPETEIWVRKAQTNPLGPVAEYAKRLEQVRKASLAKFNVNALRKGAGRPTGTNPVAKGGKATKGAGSKKSAGSKGDPKKRPAIVAKTDKKPGTPSLSIGAKPGTASDELIQRVTAIRARFDNPKVRKSQTALQGVLGDLGVLEKDSIAKKNPYARIRITQLAAKVRVAIIELKSAEAAKKRANALRPDSGVVTYNGWLRKESKLLENGTLYKLEKGGVVQCYLTTKKYDLSKFLNKHVAVYGEIMPRKRLLENIYLDVRRLKVLSK